MQKDVIAAIATGLGNSGIGIVRMSGEHICSVIDRIFISNRDYKKNNRICSVAERTSINSAKSHTIHYGYIVDGEEIVDEVLLMYMKGPHSYTAEDTVEIDCHGGAMVLRRILNTVIKYGARMAEPGEFTKRAFLNGRMDLSQSEAVIDVINAQNQFALKSSMNQLQGSVTSKVKSMREKIIYEIAFIESALDDPEHYSVDGYGEKLEKIVDTLLEELHILLKNSESGKLLKEGIDTVIVGKPNAGKSSLMNVLVGEEKAIVTEVAGTTRDILEESILLGGVQLNVIDTAGIRDTKDVVEKIGVERAKQYVEKADLIIYVVDSSVDLDENDDEIITLIQNKKVIILLNKSDLTQKITFEDVRQKFLTDINLQSMEPVFISISARERKGIEQLEQAISDLFFEGKISFNDEVYITNARHKNELLNCKNSLKMVKQSIKQQMPEDFYSIDLMSAYESLGNIIGEAVGEDLVNEIFDKFCMGK